MKQEPRHVINDYVLKNGYWFGLLRPAGLLASLTQIFTSELSTVPRSLSPDITTVANWTISTGTLTRWIGS